MKKFAHICVLVAFILLVCTISCFIDPSFISNQLNFIRTIFEITAIILGIVYISKWKIDRKQEVKEELLVSYNTLQNQIKAYIKNMFLFLAGDSIKNMKHHARANNIRNKQEIWEYRQQFVNSVSEIISPMRDKFSKSLYLAKIYKIVDNNFEDYCSKTLSDISVTFYNYIRWWGNVMCPAGKTVDEHTQQSRDSEIKIENLLNEINEKLEEKCS